MKNITISSAALSLFVSMLGMAAFVMVPSLAHAQEFGDSFGGGCCDFSGGGYTSYPDTSYTSYPDTSYTSYPDTSYTAYPDTSYTDYSTPSYSSPSSGYGGSSYMPSYGGFGGGSGGGMSQAQSQSSTNVNTNVNSCTAGSCNTSSSVNAPTTIVTNYPAQQTQPVYTPVYTPTPTYQPVYQPYQQPVAYNTRPAPYVSLSAVPYTGLDLGPWGTALYWGFLILWCLGAAYLIVVKRVQNKLVSGLNRFLFGSTTQKAAGQKSSGLPSGSGQTFAQRPSAPSVQFSGIDPFIASQIHRAAF